jgi:hypothetical protein
MTTSIQHLSPQVTEAQMVAILGRPIKDVPMRQRCLLLLGQKASANNGPWNIRRARNKWVLRRPRWTPVAIVAASGA